MIEEQPSIKDNAIAVSLSTSARHSDSGYLSSSQMDAGGGEVNLGGRASGAVVKGQSQEEEWFIDATANTMLTFV